MTTTQVGTIDPRKIRAEFPFFEQREGMRDLIYLDNAATTQKPRQVIEALVEFYATSNANVHRGAYSLSTKASELYENARLRVAQFLNARDPVEIVFTRGTTEALNLVATSWGGAFLREGDEIIISEMEHHANLLPWLQIARQKGAQIKVWSITEEGTLDLETLARLLTERTRLVAVVHVSNVLGTINPVQEICRLAHEAGALCVVDAAQSAAHFPLDVQEIGCDFLAFSGHKVYGPTGIGVLYGRQELLESMPPYQTGGGMIRRVGWDEVLWADVPYKFEAGTPPIAEAVALHRALDFVDSLGRENIARYEESLAQYALPRLRAIPYLTLYGPLQHRAGLFAFTLAGVHPHDIATIVDTYDIAIRAGHHCAHPLGDRLGVDATARASLAVYNDTDHIDALVQALQKVCEVFGLAG